MKSFTKGSITQIVILIVALIIVGVSYSLLKKYEPASRPSRPGPIATSTPITVPGKTLSEKETLEIAEDFVISEQLKGDAELECLDFDGIREGDSVTYTVSYIAKEGCIDVPHGGNQELLIVKVGLTTGIPSIWQIYSSDQYGITFQYPSESVINENHQYTALGPETTIPGISFSLPQEYFEATNLSKDSYIAIETSEKSCDPDDFVGGSKKDAIKESVAGKQYSKITSADAGAGNFYDEVVYTTLSPYTNNLCYAFRLFAHSLNIGVLQETKPAIKMYDKAGLESLLKTVIASAVYRELGGTPATPSISSISPSSSKVGDIIDIKGVNFAGFEGDKNAWIENSSGVKGIVYGMIPDSTNNLIRFKLESHYCTKDNSYSGLDCKEYLTIVPGIYDIYVYPWGKMSNKVKFTVR